MAEQINISDIKELINLSLKEDIGNGDITSEAVFNKEDRSKAVIISKERGVFCGSDIVRYIYEIIDTEVDVSPLVKDGDSIDTETETVKIIGPTVSLLSGERVALNFLQRMCGIATKTALFVSLVKDTNIKIIDTRKTLPGFRKLDKYSVQTGGGANHRMGLFDMIMIKDNHIKAAGSIRKAVNLVKDKYGTRYRIEVETTDIDEVKESLKLGVDIIMLDNMDKKKIKEAIKLINKKAEIEVSGNMDEKKIKEILDLNIDYISLGVLTHSVKAFDLSMRFM